MRPALLVLLAAAVLTGCGQGGDAASQKTQQESDRLDTIKKNSGGDWNKLSATDKDYLVNTLASGSEATAKMLLGPVQKGPAAPRKP